MMSRCLGAAWSVALGPWSSLVRFVRGVVVSRLAAVCLLLAAEGQGSGVLSSVVPICRKPCSSFPKCTSMLPQLRSCSLLLARPAKSLRRTSLHARCHILT
jgi:hypothetical protein